jgi:hypothetical protein
MQAKSAWGSVLLFVACCAAAANDEPAREKPNPKLAYLNAEESGVDFAYQGEYGGFYGMWNCGPEVGLQVVARGDGKFDGVLYGGGLPGAAWDRRTRSELTGTLEDRVLTLSNDRARVTIAPGDAAIFDTGGRRVASLIKVKRVSRTLGARPPRGAVVLFDGDDVEHFAQGAKLTDEGLLAEGATTKDPVGDFYLHLEFRLPFMPYARGQGRANSGVYIQQRYEVQILDSFGLEGAENECAGLYKQTAPSVNMCLPPLAWQTYDIFFYAPRWSRDGEKVRNARLTVLHNGVAVHRNREIKAKTGAGKEEHPNPLPIVLQNHGDPVRFRNIWMVPLPNRPPQPAYECWGPCFRVSSGY